LALPLWLIRRFGDGTYARRIARGLERAFNRAEDRLLDCSDLRAVIFSDHHRGRGDGADDFARCEHAYRAALGWYLEENYELWLLGDVEELWENRPKHAIGRYKEVLRLERAFADADRFMRFFGNHDMAWRRRRNQQRYLEDVLGKGVPVREGLKVRLIDRDQEQGLLFLVHGHQGTLDSGNLLGFMVSRFVVRVFWALLQRRKKFASTSPATDSRLRGKHDRAMFEWAKLRASSPGERPVLIAGHTHHPVFPGDAPPDLALEEAQKRMAWETAQNDPVADRRKIARARGEYEMVRSRREREDRSVLPDDKPPCYFNTGCCSFGDGDVTGIELTNEHIRLVRWLSDSGDAYPKILAARELPELLDSLRGAAPNTPGYSPGRSASAARSPESDS
jgi:UDP-2,3-diacylglucosamine pyrophosphatase LpxH